MSDILVIDMPNVTADDLRRWSAEHYAPGEAVIVKKTGETRVVRRLVADKGYLYFELEGLAERVEGGAVRDARDVIHFYGVVFAHEDAVWFAPLSTDDEAAAPLGEPCLLNGQMERHAAWASGAADVEAWLKAVAEDDAKGRPIAAEATLAPHEDGTWSVVAISWQTVADELELAAAKRSVEASMAPASAAF